MEPTDFQISDKVVCIDDSRRIGAWFDPLPVKGRVYVVRGVLPGNRCHPPKPHPGLRLVGIKAAHKDSYVLDSTCFRKLEQVRAENAAKARRKREGGA